MIQYYINAAIDILTYALKPKYEKVIENDMQTAYDLSYGSHPQQVYDFYKGTSNKLLLFIHGGAWWATNRQRDYYRGFVEAFHTAYPDINVVNMDYRLLVEDDLTTNVFPNQIDDVQKVMEIFEGYDITIAGNSAGGHLALWYYLNELTPKASNVIPITSAYDGSVVEQSTQYYTKPTGIYFENGIPRWIQEQFVDSSVNMGGATVVEYISPAYYADANLDDILAVFCTRDAEVPINQKNLMQIDYPNIKYVEYDTWHSGWMGTSFASDLRSEMYDFMLKERTYQSQHDAGRYLVQQIPEESTNNKYGHINSPFELNAMGSIDGNTFQSFKGEVMQGIISDYALKKISYNFSSFNRAFNIITPETENGYTFMVIKNNAQRYLLSHKGFSSSKYTIPKGDTNQDVEFLTLRISDTEILFFANTPEDWKYRIYYNLAGNGGLDSPTRLFTDIPSLFLFNSAVPTFEYIFRIQGEDGNGNFTEWSTDYVDGTDAFFVPLYDDESTNEYMPELEKIDLTSNLFSVVFYPTFNQGLGMIGIEHNNDQEILRSTDLDRIYANTSDAVKPNVDAVLEMHRFNNDSEQYPNLLYQLGTQDLDVRAQLEWDAINGVEIPIPTKYRLDILTTNSGLEVDDTTKLSLFSDFKLKWKPKVLIGSSSQGTASLLISKGSAYHRTNLSNGRLYRINAGNGYTNAYIRIDEIAEIEYKKVGDDMECIFSNSTNFIIPVIDIVDYPLSKAILIRRFECELMELSIDGEKFKLQEGSGNAMYGVNGTKINILGVEGTDFIWTEI